MDLTTEYLGFELPHPLVLGASPLVENLDAVRRAEDAGAAAIVMRSLYEEQITLRRRDFEYREAGDEAGPDALHYAPRVQEFVLGPDEYLAQLDRIKSAVSVPVMASLNGVTPDGWIHYASLLERAGADALELNLYAIGSDFDEPAEQLERRLLDVLSGIRAKTTVPIAVKLTPFFTSLGNFVRRLETCGADGVVLFNRYLQPDMDVDSLDVVPRLELSTPRELRLRLRWLAALSSRLRISLALSGGVHRAEDVVKGILAGAHCIQVVSEVLLHGVGVFTTLREGLRAWMEKHEIESVRQMRGYLDLEHCPNPAAHERARHMQVVNAWHPLPLDEARGVW